MDLMFGDLLQLPMQIWIVALFATLVVTILLVWVRKNFQLTKFKVSIVPEAEFERKPESLTISSQFRSRIEATQIRKLPLANRFSERDLFSRMIFGKVPKRILLIKAASGMGKTHLLAQLAHDSSKYTDTVFVSVDLKSAQTGISYVLWRVLGELGSSRFPRFATQLESFSLRANIDIMGKMVIGQPQIQITQYLDEQRRTFGLNALEQDFFEDLRHMDKKTVILLDSFNAASAELKKWIGSTFLAAAARTPKLIVVVAGQQVPLPNIEWMDQHELCRLDGIRNTEQWYSCVKVAGISFEKKEIKTLVWLHDGHPALMTKAFEKRALEMEK